MNRTCYEIFDKLKNGLELTRDDYIELLEMGAPLSLVPENTGTDVFLKLLL